MDELILKSYQFRREREASWQELDGLLRRMEAGSARSLSEAELMRLPSLYRAALSSLSVARSISLDQSLLVYLEDLANRAYFQVYGPRTGLGEMAGDFVLRRFPAAVRTLHRPILLAGFLMLLGLAAGWLLADRDPEWFYSLVPQNLAEGRLPTATTEALRQQLYEDPAAGAKDRLSVFASYLLLHNSAVGIGAFALGVALGVPTVLLMLDNGLILGAMLALYGGRGLGPAFGGWLVIHGSTELTAVTLCGGAGLALADALLFPGLRRRSEALAAAGRVAGLVVLGAILMLLVAGLLEGFARQLVTDDGARYAIGGAMAVVWLLYFRYAHDHATMTDSAAIATPGLRRIVTPEGVALGVTLADRGARAAAFVVDMLLIAAGVVGLVLASLLLFAAIKEWAAAVAMLGFFLLRNFYFSFFELRGRGVTPGKRLLGLRVIDRAGGPLRPDAVVARNLMREIEVFLPLSLLAMPQVTGDAAIAQALLIVWAAIFVLMPFFNRDRLRLGDLVGGTMVIAVPRATLASDIAGTSPSGTAKTSARYGFSDAQLEIYGIYELQTLEGVLRRTDPQSADTRQEIARRIQARIGWDGKAPAGDADRFLEDFYVAQRARLERKLLFGVRRKDKHDRS